MTRKQLLSAVVVLALVTESVLLALLAERHRTLRSDMLRVRRDALVPRAGTFYPSFDAVDVAANHHWRVGAPDSGRAQLVLVYSRTCQFCRASLPAWRALLHGVDSLGTTQVIVVALDSLRASQDSLSLGGIQSPVVAYPMTRELALAKASATPQSVLIGSNGRILAAHTGLVTDSVVSLFLRAAATPR